MAKRRKVGNLLALGVLHVLHSRPMHPYEIATTLREWGKEHDMGVRVKWGSLYTVVRNLEKHGFVAAVATTRQGGRPERTVYEITENGRAELVDWTRELVATPEPEHRRFQAGLSGIGVLPPDEATRLLRDRLETLEREIAQRRADLATHGQGVPRLFLVESEYELAMREAEVNWVRALVEELTTGAFPGLEPWREWHRTGRMPPEVAELAERGRADD